MSIKRTYVYPFILLGIALISYSLGIELTQVASLTVFSSLILGTLLFWKSRLTFALVGIAALMTLNLLNTNALIEFANLDIILFLVAMMIVIGYLEDRRFFEYLLEKILSRVGKNPNKLIIILMLMSGMFAALVDEVTSILFMAATVIHLTAKLKVNPVPFIIMIVFATNIGSSATVVGNPVSVLIALRAELTFMDFLRWATPISIVGLMVSIPLSMRYFSKDIKQLGKAMTSQLGYSDSDGTKRQNLSESTGKNAPHDPNQGPVKKNIQDYRIPWIIFLGTIGGLVVHSPVEEILGLEKNSMLLATAFAAAGLSLFMVGQRARDLVERRVDWWTLAFFIFLFASVGTLQLTGVTTLIANSLFELSGGDETNLFFIFSYSAGITSAFMDNILGVATFIPVVNEMEALGINNYPLWWGLLFAGTFFGNLTLIGSTANIVAIGMLERRNRGHITLLQWIKPGLLVSIPTLTLALLLIYVQIPLMPNES